MSQKDEFILAALKPLESLFTSLSSEKAKIYLKHLQHFELEIIRKAVERVEGHWDKLSFPPCGIIVQECEKLMNSSRKTQVQSSGVYPWDKRKADQDAAVSDYVKAFRLGQICRESAIEGYEDDLLEYVREIAGIQAQMIYPHPLGYLFSIRWKAVLPECDDSKQKYAIERQLLRDCKYACAAGSIDVAVPTSWITEWKRRRGISNHQPQQELEAYGLVT